MNFSALKNLNSVGVKRVAVKTFHRGVVLTKKYSPEILTGLGVAGSVTTTVLASKATLKLEPIVDSTREGVEHVRTQRNQPGYSERDYVKDLSYVYVINGRDLVKLYGPAFTLGVASIGCILGAHGIMRKRNVALVAAYNGIEKSLSQYRERVANELGIDRERDIWRGAEVREVKNEETGEVEKQEHFDPNQISTYARFFDEFNVNWSKDPGYNRLFVKTQQNFANDLLQSRGHLFLNEVYDMLGLERDSVGAVVGWVISKDGDNFVDFGLFDADNERAREFVNGHERSILLDFNVDGVIYDRI